VDISAVIIHFGPSDYTRHVVDCLPGAAGEFSVECVIVDNASEPPLDSTPQDAPLPLRIVRIEASRGYGAACNAGADGAKGRYILILNNDLDIPASAVAELVRTLDADPGIGAVGPMLRFPDGRFQLSWGDDPTLKAEFQEKKRQRSSREGGVPLGRMSESTESRDVEWITGAVMLIRREAWEAVGGFDEAFYFYFEDADICRRIRNAGYRVVYQPGASMVHFGGGSDPLSNARIVRAYRREQLRYYARYNSVAQFYLLKCYLLAKFFLLRLRRGIDRETGLILLKDVASFPRSEGKTQQTRNRS